MTGTSATWRTETFPEPLRGTVGTLEVEDAHLTPWTTGSLAIVGRPDLWVRGAVHDSEGLLLAESQRLRAGGGDRVVAADPGRARVPPGAERLEGRWTYGGHWMGPFGHFITETLTNLWVEPDAEGLLFHRWLSQDSSPREWQLELLDLAGHGHEPIRVVTGAPVTVERLTVPGRPFVIGGWAHPEAVRVWRRVSRALPVGPARVFLSRSRFNAAQAAAGRPVRTGPERDTALDRDFAAAGFEVAHTDELSIPDQLALVAHAQVIAGLAGSALHLSAFAQQPARVIEVGDDRSPTQRLLGQRIIDAACGHRVAMVPADASAAEVLDRLDLSL